MQIHKIAYLSGSLLGLIAVIAGALGAHGLKGQLSPDSMGSFETAVRFQMYHALLLLIVGYFLEKKPHKLGTRSFWAILVGTILFSGSIYLLVLTPLSLGLVTPLGGSILIFGWALMAFWLYQS
ncbi:MAG: DUF423 domain-containing protein [Bacteroidota bacterium]